MQRLGSRLGLNPRGEWWAVSAADQRSEAARPSAGLLLPPSPAVPVPAVGWSSAIDLGGDQRLSNLLGGNSGSLQGSRNQGAELCLSASHWVWRAPRWAMNFSPAELAEFLLHYGALRWRIQEQPPCLGPCGKPWRQVRGPHLFFMFKK